MARFGQSFQVLDLGALLGRPASRLPAFREQIRARSGDRDLAACVFDLGGLGLAAAHTAGSGGLENDAEDLERPAASAGKPEARQDRLQA